MNRIGLYSVMFLALTTAGANAHPVAQGSMEITTQADHIDIVALVSTEEAFVADALGSKGDAGTLEEVWRRHGDYLLDHLTVEVDGVRLTGTVEKFAALDATAKVRYDLRFVIPGSKSVPRSITLKQNILNEFSFAPGNSWEATYIVKVVGTSSSEEGLLFTSREPLIIGGTHTGMANHGAFAAFLLHGIRHILGGYDHLLFIAGLVLAVVSFWDLVKVVTAFTLAHTITLTLAVLDVVRLSNQIVEPMIAASIVFVACQNLLAPTHARGPLRLLIAFGFGLFHGLGFAGGLLSAMEGMPAVTVTTAIIAFSLGVEAGHQFVALPLFAAMRLARRKVGSSSGERESLHLWISRLGSGAIGVAGTVYLVAALLWIR
jgi:hypothetical protein